MSKHRVAFAAFALAAALFGLAPTPGIAATPSGSPHVDEVVSDVCRMVVKSRMERTRDVPAPTDFHDAFDVDPALGAGGYPAYGASFDATLPAGVTDDALNAAKDAVRAENVAIMQYDAIDADGNLYLGGMRKDADANRPATVVTRLVRHTAGVANYGRAIPDAAPAVTERLSLRMYRHGNVASGLYAPPGEVVKVTLISTTADKDPADLGLKALIGTFGGNAEQSNIPARGFAYTRMPIANKDLALNKTVTYIGSPLGGPILIHSAGIGGEVVELEIDGAVEMPTYYLGETSVAELARQLVAAPGPAFAFSTPRGVRATGPVSNLAGLTAPDIEAAMRFWDKAMGVSYQFSHGAFDPADPDTNLMVEIFDPHIPAGAAVNMGAYCICPVSWGASFLDAERYMTAGGWGVIHEFNHSFRWGGATDGIVEVENNVISSLTYQLYTNIAATRSAYAALDGWNWCADAYNTCERIRRVRAENYAAGNKTENVELYAALQHAFGADAFIDMVARYRAAGGREGRLAGNERLTNSNVWLYATSESTGYDMTYYLRDVLHFPVHDTPGEQEGTSDYLTSAVIAEATGASAGGAARPVYIPSGCLYASGYVYAAGTEAERTVEMGRPYRIPYGASMTLDFHATTTGGCVSVTNGESIELGGVTAPEHGTLTPTDDPLVWTYAPSGEHLEDSLTVTLRLGVTDEASSYRGRTADVTYKLAFAQVNGGFGATTYYWDYSKGWAEQLDWFGRHPTYVGDTRWGPLRSVYAQGVAGFDATSATDPAWGASYTVVEGKVWLDRTGEVDLYVRGKRFLHTGIAADAAALPAVFDAEAHTQSQVRDAVAAYDPTDESTHLRVYVVPEGKDAPANAGDYDAVIAEGDPLYVRAHVVNPRGDVTGACSYHLGILDDGTVRDLTPAETSLMGVPATMGERTPAVSDYPTEKRYSSADPADVATTLSRPFEQVGTPMTVRRVWDLDADDGAGATMATHSGVAASIVDNDLSTFYHGKPTGASFAGDLVVELDDATASFNTLIYRGHPDNDDRGKIKDYEVYVGDDYDELIAADASSPLLVASGTASQRSDYALDGTAKLHTKIDLGKSAHGRYVRLVGRSVYPSNYTQYYYAFTDLRVGNLTTIDGAGRLSGDAALSGSWGVDEGITNTRGALNATANGMATYAFGGTGVVLYAVTGPTYGTALVSLDGAEPVEVNLHSDAVRGQQPVWWETGLDAGCAHTLTVTPKAPGADRINVECIETKGTVDPAGLPVAPNPDDGTTGLTVTSERIGEGGHGAVFDPVFSPHDADTFLAICDMGGLYTTHDAGKSWNVNAIGGRIWCAEADPTTPGTFYAGGSGLWRSTDNGDTWSLLLPKQADVEYTQARLNHNRTYHFSRAGDGYLDGSLVVDVAIDDKDPNHIVAMQADGYGYANSQCGVSESFDGGATFEVVATFTEAKAERDRTMLNLRVFIEHGTGDDKGRVVVAIPDGIYEVDRAATDVNAALTDLYVTPTSADPAKPDTSIGAVEQVIDKNDAYHYVVLENVNDATAAALGSRVRIWHTCDFGALEDKGKTVDLTTEFSQMPRSFQRGSGDTTPCRIELHDAIALCAPSLDRIYVSYRSYDTYKLKGDGAIDPGTKFNVTWQGVGGLVTYDATRDAGERFAWDFGPRLYWNGDDAGTPLTPDHNYLMRRAYMDSTTAMLGLAADPNNPRRILLGTHAALLYSPDIDADVGGRWDGGRWYRNVNLYPLYSEIVDGDVTLGGRVPAGKALVLDEWRSRTTGLDVTVSYCLSEDPFDPQHLVRGLDDGCQEVSFDGGATWSRLRTTFPEAAHDTCYAFVFDEGAQGEAWATFDTAGGSFTEPGTHYLDTKGLLAHTTDGGLTWQTDGYGGGLPPNAAIVSVDVAYPRDGDGNITGGDRTLYVATMGFGVYVSRDSGKTFAPMNDGIPTVDITYTADKAKVTLPAVWARQVLATGDGRLFAVTQYSSLGPSVNGASATYFSTQDERTFGNVWEWDKAADTWVRLPLNYAGGFKDDGSPNVRQPRSVAYDATTRTLYVAGVTVIGPGRPTSKGGTRYTNFGGGVYAYTTTEGTAVGQGTAAALAGLPAELARDRVTGQMVGYDQRSFIGVSLDSLGRLWLATEDGDVWVRRADTGAWAKVFEQALRLNISLDAGGDGRMYLNTRGVSTIKISADEPVVTPQPRVVTFADEALYHGVVAQLAEQGVAFARSDAERSVTLSPAELAKVTSLALSDLGITTLDGLGSLTALRELDLSRNHIVDLTPLKTLTELGKLVAPGNDISSVAALTGDDGGTPFSKLAWLDLSSNRLADEELGGDETAVTSRLHALPLAHLDLSHNQLRRLPGVWMITGLTYLDVNDNHLRDISGISRNMGTQYSYEATLKLLRHLDLGANNPGGATMSGLDALKELSSLTYFDFSDNHRANIMYYLRYLYRLRTLRLEGNDIADANLHSNGTSYFNNLTSLTTLVLARNKLTDVSRVLGLANLRELSLRDNRLAYTAEGSAETDSLFGVVADAEAGTLAWPRLERLDLTGNFVSGATFQQPPELATLYALSTTGEPGALELGYDYRTVPGLDTTTRLHVDEDGTAYTTYDDFGARHDGSYDDYIAIYNAHAFAAENGGCEVRATVGDAADAAVGLTYHLFKPLSGHVAHVTGDVDWQGATLRVHDEEIDHRSGRTDPLFSIQVTAEQAAGPGGEVRRSVRGATFSFAPIATGCAIVRGRVDKPEAYLRDLAFVACGGLDVKDIAHHLDDEGLVDSYRGLLTFVGCSDLAVDGCDTYTVNAQGGVSGLTVRDCAVGRAGIVASGAGTLRVKDSTVTADSLVRLAGDAGGSWAGDVVLDGCAWHPLGELRGRIIDADFATVADGTVARFPNVLVDRLAIDDGTNATPAEYDVVSNGLWAFDNDEGMADRVAESYWPTSVTVNRASLAGDDAAGDGTLNLTATDLGTIATGKGTDTRSYWAGDVSVVVGATGDDAADTDDGGGLEATADLTHALLGGAAPTVDGPVTVVVRTSPIAANAVAVTCDDAVASAPATVGEGTWEQTFDKPGSYTVTIASDSNAHHWTATRALAFTIAEPPHEHAWGTGVPTQAATCTQRGVTTYTCACGETTVEMTPALGHDWEAAETVDVAATATTPGSASVHCSRCGAAKDVRTIDATGTADGLAVSATRLGIGGHGALFHPLVSPHDPKTLVASCDMGGLYTSHDGGDHWSCATCEGRVWCVKADPSTAGTFYAGSSGLWRSRDNGDSWQLVFPRPGAVEHAPSMLNQNRSFYYTTDTFPDGMLVADVAVDAADPNHLVVLCADSYTSKSMRCAVCESLDGGTSFAVIATFTATKAARDTGIETHHVFVEHPVGTVSAQGRVVVSIPDGIYEVDRAATEAGAALKGLHVTPAGASDKSVADVAQVRGEDGTYHYVVLENVDAATAAALGSRVRIWHTPDFADPSRTVDLTGEFARLPRHYNAKADGTGASYEITCHDAIMLCAPSLERIYVSYRTRDLTNPGGEGWQGVSGLVTYDATRDAGTRFAWTYGRRLTWTGVDADTPLTPNQNHLMAHGYNDGNFTMLGIAADPADARHVVLATHTALYVSPNIDERVTGETFNGEPKVNLYPAYAVTVDADKTLGGRISAESPLNYHEYRMRSTGLDVTVTYHVREDPFNSRHLVLCMDDAGCAHSFDGGATWSRLYTRFPRSTSDACFDMAFDAGNEGEAYAVWDERGHGAYTTETDFLTTRAAFAHSGDGGLTWTTAGYGAGLPAGATGVALAVDYPRDGSGAITGQERTIYVATMGYGIYVSHDSGHTFEAMNAGIPTVDSTVDDITCPAVWARDVMVTGDGRLFAMTQYSTLGPKDGRGERTRFDTQDGRSFGNVWEWDATAGGGEGAWVRLPLNYEGALKDDDTPNVRQPRAMAYDDATRTLYVGGVTVIGPWAQTSAGGGRPTNFGGGVYAYVAERDAPVGLGTVSELAGLPKALAGDGRSVTGVGLDATRRLWLATEDGDVWVRRTDAVTWTQVALGVMRRCSGFDPASDGGMFLDTTGVSAVRLAASEPAWDDPTYLWSADHTRVTATRSRVDGTETETETVATTSAVTAEATYEVAGAMTYTSAEFANAAFVRQTATVTIPKLVKAPDDGAGERRVGIGGGGALFDPAINPLNANEMAVGTDMGDLYVTRDGGASWAKKSVGRVFSVSFDPTRDGVVYAGGSGLWRSTDHGETFSLLWPKQGTLTGDPTKYEDFRHYLYNTDGFIPSSSVISVAVDREHNDNLYALVRYTRYDAQWNSLGPGLALVRSADGGGTFAQIATMAYDAHGIDALDDTSKVLVHEGTPWVCTHDGVYAYDEAREDGLRPVYAPDGTEHVAILDICQATSDGTDGLAAGTYCWMAESVEDKASEPASSLRRFRVLDDGTLQFVDLTDDMNDSAKGLDRTNQGTGATMAMSIKELAAPSATRVYFTVCGPNDVGASNVGTLLVRYDGACDPPFRWVLGQQVEDRTQLNGTVPGRMELQNLGYADSYLLMYGLAANPAVPGQFLVAGGAGLYGSVDCEVVCEPQTSDYPRTSNIYQLYANRHEDAQVDAYGGYDRDETDKLTFSSTGIDNMTTYGVRVDPFDPNHVAILSTDQNLVLSHDGGTSWSTRKTSDNRDWAGTRTGGWSRVPTSWANTVYDLEFDPYVKGRLYALWSGRHDAPYETYASDRDEQGGFAVANMTDDDWDSLIVSWTKADGTTALCDRGGNAVDTALPKNCVPVRMGVVYPGDKVAREAGTNRTFWVACFGAGFYRSTDSGTTFAEVNTGISERTDDLVFATDIEVSADGSRVFGMTGRRTDVGGARGRVYLWDGDMEDGAGSWAEIPLPDGVTCPRDLFWDEGGETLYISCVAANSKKSAATGYPDFYNHHGGIYVWHPGDPQATQLDATSEAVGDATSVEGVAVDGAGNLFASDLRGNIWLRRAGTTAFERIHGQFHQISKNVQLLSEKVEGGKRIDTIVLPSFGGGTLVKEVELSTTCAHALKRVDAVGPTCTEPGVVGHWRCGRCGRLFSDADAAAEATEAALAVGALGHAPGQPSLENVVAAGCEVDGGYDSVTRCVRCGEELTRARVAVPAAGHDWEFSGFAWGAPDQRATACYACRNEASHTTSVAAEVRELSRVESYRAEGSVTLVARVGAQESPDGTAHESGERTFPVPRLEPVAVRVLGIVAADKDYDGTTEAVLDASNATFVDGNDVPVDPADAPSVEVEGSFESADASEAAVVDITSVVLADDREGKYVLVEGGQQAMATAAIRPRAVTLRWGDTTREYDGEAFVPDVTVDGLLDGDASGVVLDVGAVVPSALTEGRAVDVGSYRATATGLTNDNYTLGDVGRARPFSITPRVVPVSWAGVALTYSGEPQAPVATLAGGAVLERDAGRVSVVVAGARTLPGAYEATAALAGERGAQYAVDPRVASAAFEIAPAGGLAVVVLGWEGAYDGASHGVDVRTNVSEGVTLAYATVDPTSADFDADGWSDEAPTWTHVTDGPRRVWVRASLAHHDDATGAATVEVSPREVGVTWGETSFRRDGAAHVPTAMVMGVLPGESCEAEVAVSPAAGSVLSGGRAVEAGDYLATVTGLSNPDYRLAGDVRQAAFEVVAAPPGPDPDLGPNPAPASGAMRVGTVAGNWGDAELAGTADELVSAVLTAEDRESLAAGADVSVWVETADGADAVPDGDRLAIVAGAGPYAVGHVFDARLLKRVGTGVPVPVGEPAGAVAVRVLVPDDLPAVPAGMARRFAVLRLHAGVVDVLEATLDAAGQHLTFASDRFSTYAVAYRDVPADAVAGPADAGQRRGAEGGRADERGNAATGARPAAAPPAPSGSVPAATSVNPSPARLAKTGDPWSPGAWRKLARSALLLLLAGVACRLGARRTTR